VILSTDKGTPTVQAQLDGTQRRVIVDTGSSISLIQPGVSCSLVKETSILPIGITGNELPLRGEQMLGFCLDNRAFYHRFGVCTLPTEADDLLGTDFLAAINARIGFANQRLEVNPSPQYSQSPVHRPFSNCIGETERPVALTVFPARDGQVSRNVKSTDSREFKCATTPVRRMHPHELNFLESEAWEVKTTEPIRLAPRAKQMIIGKLEVPKRREKPRLICIEPVLLPF
jgi:hypothetical protein